MSVVGLGGVADVVADPRYATAPRMITDVEGLSEGTRVAGRYRIVRKLGAGGMGAVYEAVQEALNRKVALKVLLPAYAQDPEAVARFHREAQAAASLGHANIVSVTDFGADNGVVFLVMEYLTGASLGQVLDHDKALAPGRAAWIASQMLSALSVAHQAGIVHRDIKPDNIYLTEVSGMPDVVKILDFGIARFTEQSKDSKLTHTGAVLGTPMYMSPEQARGRAVDVRTDVYAVGAILYEMLTGRLPFAAQNVHALLFAILEETPTPIRSLRPEVVPGLVSVVEQAMAKDLQARFQTAEQFRVALEPYVDRSVARTTGSFVPSTRESPMVTAPTMAAPAYTGPLGSAFASGPQPTPTPITTPTPEPFVAQPLPVAASNPSVPLSSQPSQPSYPSHPSHPSHLQQPPQPSHSPPIASPSGRDARGPRPAWVPLVGASIIALAGVGVGFALKGSGSRETPQSSVYSIDDAVRAAIARLDASVQQANALEQHVNEQLDAAASAQPQQPIATAQPDSGSGLRGVRGHRRSGGASVGSVSAGDPLGPGPARTTNTATPTGVPRRVTTSYAGGMGLVANIRESVLANLQPLYPALSRCASATYIPPNEGADDHWGMDFVFSLDSSSGAITAANPRGTGLDAYPRLVHCVRSATIGRTLVNENIPSEITVFFRNRYAR